MLEEEEKGESQDENKPDAEKAVKVNGLNIPKIDLVERVKSVDKRLLFFLLVLFVLAFGTRAHLLKYDLLFGFDSYYHARMAGTLIETGVVPEIDPMSYYFMEGGVPAPKNQFLWHFSAAIYNVTTLGRGYDKELWIQYVKWLPALFGALTAVGMFFLGKEMYGKKAGYVMAMVAAIIPSFVYRTLAGFFEEDCLGFLWFVIGMVFFVRAVKIPVFNRRGQCGSFRPFLRNYGDYLGDVPACSACARPLLCVCNDAYLHQDGSAENV